VSHERLQSAIDARRRRSDRRLKRFGGKLSEALGRDTGKLIGNHTCIYAVGSAGRGELAPQSDLDLFVVRCGDVASNIDAVLLQAGIVKASRRAGFPEPSGDGEWLKLHTAKRFVELLGSVADDTENTFTARMLLLLESRLVLGSVAYDRIIESVIDAYWRNAAGHPNDYQPIVLLNDIVRYWRILLLNYEAKNVSQQAQPQTVAERDAKRRLRGYKLRFSRCLICYSALAYLLALTNGAPAPHVAQKDVRALVALSPLERLLWVREHASAVEGVGDLVDRLLESYLDFMTLADQGKEALEKQFRLTSFRSERSREGMEFGERMFKLVTLLGRDNPLFRWLVV
jgi:hypothetical protein